MKDFKQILYPVALTDISPRVAPYVATLARQLDADVHLLHVMKRFDWLVDTYVEEPPEPDFKQIASDFETRLLARAEEKMKAFETRHLKDVRVVKSTIISGTHYKRILDYAATSAIDLIVMGTGTTLQKVVFGSVAEKVSRLASMPVMLVKVEKSDS